jgi:rhamnulose-1-phosphate aldolase
MSHEKDCHQTLDQIASEMGVVGQRLVEIGATEGGAGNLSVYYTSSLKFEHLFPQEESVTLPLRVPALAERWVLATGSGCRLRDIKEDPPGNLGLLRINPDGDTASLYSSHRRNFTRLTSELNSHLAVHQDYAARTGGEFQSLVHAQPVHLTFLSHLPRYQEQDYLNRALLRWQPETIVNFPEGIGFIPFLVPGSTELMQANVAMLRNHRLVIWSKHGVMARFAGSILHAVDWVEYVEAAAHYEYLNLTLGESESGLTGPEIQQICRAFGVDQSIF